MKNEKVIGFSMVILISILITGCHTNPKTESVTVCGIYDNGGGFAYGGEAMTIRDDGTFEEWFYSDAVGDEHLRRSGTWVADGMTVTLTPAKWNPTFPGLKGVFKLHMVIVKSDVMLLDDDQYQQFTSSSKNKKILKPKLKKIR